MSPKGFEHAFLTSYRTQAYALDRAATGNISRNYLILETLNGELNPICHLQTLLGAHHILHVFRIGVKLRLFSKSKKI